MGQFSVTSYGATGSVLSDIQQTKLSIQDMATCKVFLNRILEILPLTGLGAFENSQKNETLSIDEKSSGSLAFEEPDTIEVVLLFRTGLRLS